MSKTTKNFLSNKLRYHTSAFDRYGFKEMLAGIEAGNIDCVIVKDLSRFGRDYIDMGYYLERYFPSRGVRFIAINDNVDSLSGPYDMLLPLKNVFNAQYAKDISDKVRSAFKAKQRRGDFVGAFASYGYLKDPEARNHLIIDPVAAETVLRIFRMAAGGVGQIRIAKTLNAEGVPCPSEYKRLMGEKYTNNHRLESTRYWTYATIHRILQNEMYLGNMVAARPGTARRESEKKRLEGALERVRRLKQGAYEDYRDKLLSREEFLRYKADYDAQEDTLSRQLERAAVPDGDDALRCPWVEELVSRGALRELDRATLAQTVRQIRVFEDRHIEIAYLFGDELRLLLETQDT